MMSGTRILASGEGPVLVTVPNIPICATGIEYMLSTGPATFTEEDLIDAAASQEDPAIRSPRLGLGHIDPRFNNPQYDGEPAFGKFSNLRVDSSGQVLIADAVGVPKWLADVMPVAYPNRSIEGIVAAETVTGHTWGLVIEAVKLLGVRWPGVSTLEDLPLFYGEDVPEGVQIVNPETGEEVAVGKVAAAGGPVSAAVAVEDIRRQFYDQLDADQMWWWIRSMYLDPNELIVDNDDGTLYRVPFATKGEVVEFSDPVEVKIQYVDASKKSRFGRKNKIELALVASAGRNVASWTEREASRPADTNDPEEVVDMKIDVKALRSRLGLTEEQLPDDATEDQVNAVLAETPPPDDPPPAGDEEPDDDNDEDDDAGDAGDGEGAPEGAGKEPVAASNGTVTVPAKEWERVQEQAAKGAKVADAAEVSERETVIKAAIKAGKIAPADKASYQNMFKENPESARRLLTASVDKGGLREGLIPVSERGVAEPDGEGVAASDGYDQSWLTPKERQRIQAVKDGTYEAPTVEADGALPAGVNGNRA